MLFTADAVKTEDLKNVCNFFEQFDKDYDAAHADACEDEDLSKYISSLVTSQYKKSVEDIENTHIGNRVVRKRNLTQVMQESFFCGANRFGNNFIA